MLRTACAWLTLGMLGLLGLMGCQSAPQPPPITQSAAETQPDTTAHRQQTLDAALTMMGHWAAHPHTVGAPAPIRLLDSDLETAELAVDWEAQRVTVSGPTLSAERRSQPIALSPAEIVALPPASSVRPSFPAHNHYADLPDAAALVDAIVWGWVYLPDGASPTPHGLTTHLNLSLTDEARAALTQAFPDAQLLRHTNGALAVRIVANGKHYAWLATQSHSEATSPTAKAPRLVLARSVSVVASDEAHQVYRRCGLETLDKWTVLSTGWDEV